MLLRLRFVTLIFLGFLCLFRMGYLVCSSFTTHCCLAFSPFWCCVLRAWMGAPIKTYPNHRVGPVSHTTQNDTPYATYKKPVTQSHHLKNHTKLEKCRNLKFSGKLFDAQLMHLCKVPLNPTEDCFSRWPPLTLVGYCYTLKWCNVLNIRHRKQFWGARNTTELSV